MVGVRRRQGAHARGPAQHAADVVAGLGGQHDVVDDAGGGGREGPAPVVGGRGGGRVGGHGPDRDVGLRPSPDVVPAQFVAAQDPLAEDVAPRDDQREQGRVGLAQQVAGLGDLPKRLGVGEGGRVVGRGVLDQHDGQAEAMAQPRKAQQRLDVRAGQAQLRARRDVGGQRAVDDPQPGLEAAVGGLVDGEVAAVVEEAGQNVAE
ncbi:MAG: hypothetical protein F4Y94_09720 [Chloroflexi bacterium]|nr:hypothetical protein [Chloroflexota bacterium]